MTKRDSVRAVKAWAVVQPDEGIVYISSSENVCKVFATAAGTNLSVIRCIVTPIRAGTKNGKKGKGR